MRMCDLMREEYEPSETAKLFHTTADTQRGPPESKMMELQRLLGGGVYSFAVEHIGDITHRMTEKFDWAKGQLGLVQDKVEKTLQTLEHPYGFKKEMRENLWNNFEYNLEHGTAKYSTWPEFERMVTQLAKEYAAEHRKVPVFNEPQMHAREAAVAMGEFKFDEAIAHLRWLKDLCDDEERYNHEVAQVTMKEGMDNGYFLTPLTGRGPTIYPLPTDATEYELAEDGTWYHGSPEVQKLGKEFENRTINVDYLTNPKGWLEIQDKIGQYESGSDEYMDLLDAASKMRANKKVRSPVFLSSKNEVASTYADDRRAFDYQSAVPGVVPVEVADGKTLTISGAGQDFRGISIDSVRNGLRKAGIDDKTIDNQIMQFAHQIRGDGGTISTSSLAAIVDDLGYDIIDVTHIRDNYRGDGPPATVRMVMNPSLIRIKQ